MVGFARGEVDPPVARGRCDPKHNRIVVDSDVATTARLRTVVHEAIHALGLDYQQYPLRAEVIVDTTLVVSRIAPSVRGLVSDS
jgi:hypothetical protein